MAICFRQSSGMAENQKGPFRLSQELDLYR